MSAIEERLLQRGVKLPAATAPVANYAPFVRSGPLVFISGQISIGPDGLIKGRLGETVTIEEGIAAARMCGLNLLAQMKAACEGDLDRVWRVVRLGVFVASAPEFIDHPKIANGASDLMVEAFGDMGRHARAAVGAPSLPLGAAVEVEATIEIA